MEHGEDRELRELLREWSVPDAPPSLDQRVLGGRRSGREAWWRFLLTGSIRIPVPVGMAFAAVLLVTIGGLIRQRPAPAPAPSTVSLVDFRPVSDLNVRVIRQHESN
ncbi:MAG TPA: hypothetical protein VNY05_15055 [Candidatus Acidoferrales bacterium]|jgi:hypothetical protein|nr:hypothetical protein [Candidatus Acidoferrales bacterium]